jgi:hypothetical protein
MSLYVLTTHNFFIFGLSITKICDDILHLEFGFVEKPCPTFHNTFEPFPLVIV